MESEFWKYWKQRWPNASSDEKILRPSANYQETRAAFEAGYKAAQQSAQTASCTHSQTFIENGEEVCGWCGAVLKSSDHRRAQSGEQDVPAKSLE